MLFEFDNNATPDLKVPLLKRTELVAMFNTYARAESSMNAITQFRTMVDSAAETPLPE